MTLAHRESVASFIDDDAPVAFRGSCPTGRAPGSRRRRHARAGQPPRHRGDLWLVVAVLPFEQHEADAIALANHTEYGLSGSIWDQRSRAVAFSLRAVEGGNLSGELALFSAVLDPVRWL